MNKLNFTNEHPDQIGTCEVCGHQYVSAVYSCCQATYEDTTPRNCPSCKYLFGIGFEIRKIIMRVDPSIEISSSGNIRFNTGELVSLLETKLKEIWPK